MVCMFGYRGTGQIKKMSVVVKQQFSFIYGGIQFAAFIYSENNAADDEGNKAHEGHVLTHHFEQEVYTRVSSGPGQSC